MFRSLGWRYPQATSSHADGRPTRFVGEPVDVVIEDEEKQAGWTAEYIWFERKDPTPTHTIPRKQLATFTVNEVKHGHLQG